MPELHLENVEEQLPPNRLALADLKSELDNFARDVFAPQLKLVADRMETSIQKGLEALSIVIRDERDRASVNHTKSGQRAEWKCEEAADARDSSLGSMSTGLVDGQKMTQTLTEQMRKRTGKETAPKDKPSPSVMKTIISEEGPQKLVTADNLPTQSGEEAGEQPEFYKWKSTLALESSMTQFLNETKLERLRRAFSYSTGGTCSEILAPIVSSPWFDVLVTAAIVANGIYIGVSTDYMAQRRLSTAPVEFDVIELLFLCIFVMELVLKFSLNGFALFRRKTVHGVPTPDRNWNIFDFAVIGVQSVEFLIRLADIDDLNFFGKISVLRILRLLRAMRIVRIIKVSHWVGDLRMIVYSIQRSLSLFIWAMVVLVMVIYIFAIYFLSFVLDYRTVIDSAHPDYSQQREQDLDMHFGSLVRTGFTLFKIVAGGVDWGEMAVLLDNDWLFGQCVLVGYVGFTLIAVMNVISGVFLDTAMERAKQERELYLVKSAQTVFERADHTRDGTITWADFEISMAHVDVETFFSSIDLDVSQAQGLFELLDTSSDGFISSDEFLKGCLRLRGPAKALDLLALSREVMLHFRRQETQLRGNREAMVQHKDELQTVLQSTALQAFASGRSDESPPSCFPGALPDDS